VGRRPRIAWALGGGGARGLAHLGVLRVLEREKIPIDFLAGTSMGAAVAVVYAASKNLKYLASLAENINWENLFDLRFPRLGLISGKHIISFIKILSKDKKLEELTPPVWVLATDLLTGEEVIFKEGDVELAVRASISIPGIFTPVNYQGRLLVDGGVVAGVPVRAARQMGADLVIAVNVAGDSSDLPPKNFVEILMKTVDIMGTRLNRIQVAEADLALSPEIGSVGTGHFHRAADCIKKGEEAALKSLPQIKEIIRGFTIKGSGSGFGFGEEKVPQRPETEVSVGACPEEPGLSEKVASERG